jgi:hypothetical protein
VHALTRVLPGTGSQSGSIHYEYTVSEELKKVGCACLGTLVCFDSTWIACLVMSECKDTSYEDTTLHPLHAYMVYPDICDRVRLLLQATMKPLKRDARGRDEEEEGGVASESETVRQNGG